VDRRKKGFLRGLWIIGRGWSQKGGKGKKSLEKPLVDRAEKDDSTPFYPYRGQEKRGKGGGREKRRNGR